MQNDLPSPELTWHLAYTKPRQEEVARFHLERQGFAVYLPLFKKLKRSAEGAIGVDEPMFPRYLFFRPQKPEQSLSVVRNTKGISHLVRFGFEPAMVHEGLLQGIRDIERARQTASLEELNPLKRGQSVRLQHSALQGLEGVVQAVSSKRVQVLLEILGRPTVVAFEHHQVQAEDAKI